MSSELEENDGKEIQQRKDELSGKVREVAKALFEDALAKIKEAKEQHARHLAGRGKKRKTGSGDATDTSAG
eukprot:4193753-Pyramimonas_sp.AAC.1